ncbi:helix-turn-helix transcriptional regulator [Flavobacterium sp. I3-2]|uniref:LexA family transcriptional regulator n=1 Tax=Flavobacterium sp. I3-2 TaxID=2748319 RepID=UPI0015B37218|nr:S24 family peptidase [Flavobacterium sp. I3-2]
MSVKDKLKQYLKLKGIKIREFESIIGVTNGYVNNISKGIGGDKLEKIRENFPDLDIKLLLDDSITDLSIINNSDAVNTPHNGVPYFEDIEGTAGITTSYTDFKEMPTFYIDYEHFNDCTAYVPIVGDSMYPTFCSGEIIAIKKVFNLDVILWGEAYFVVTNGNANDIRAAKLLFPHDEGSKIILRSSNPNYKGDTVINKVDILHLYLIKGKIHRKHL